LGGEKVICCHREYEVEVIGRLVQEERKKKERTGPYESLEPGRWTGEMLEANINSELLKVVEMQARVKSLRKAFR